MATFSVPTMSCDHCKARIESALNALDGVRDVTVDLNDKTVKVDSDLAVQSIADTLSEIGYEATAV